MGDHFFAQEGGFAGAVDAYDEVHLCLAAGGLYSLFCHILNFFLCVLFVIENKVVFLQRQMGEGMPVMG